MNYKKQKSNALKIIIINLILAIVLAVISFKISSTVNTAFMILFGIIVIISNFMADIKYIASIISTVPIGYGIAIFTSHMLDNIQNNSMLNVLISSLSSFGNYFLPMVITSLCSGLIMISKFLISRRRINEE